MTNPFDDISKGSLQEYRPLWTVDFDDEDDILSWAQAQYFNLSNNEYDRIERIRNNIGLYKGYVRDYESIEANRFYPRANKSSSTPIPVLTNHIQDLVKQRIIQLLNNKPTTIVTAASTDFSDRVAAKSGEDLLNYLKYVNEIEVIYYKVCKMGILAGEAFCGTLWDSSRGPEHPDYKKLKGKGIKKIPLLAGNGDPVKDVYGNEVMIEPPQRIGDLRYFVPQSENVFVDVQSDDPNDSNWILIRSYPNIWELKSQYPDLADEIKSYDDTIGLSYATGDLIPLVNRTVVLEFWHKSHKELPNGLYFKCTPTVVLEPPRELMMPTAGMEEFEFGNIPFERFKDEDIDGEIHGWSSVNNISRLQNRYDRCTGLIDTNIFTIVHPKWFLPAGSCKLESLGNGSTIVEYQGPIAPVVQTFQAVTQDVFAHRDTTLENMEKIFGVFSLTRGAPPPGTRSGQQMSLYMGEQEKRSSIQKMKFDRFVVNLDRKGLGVCSVWYKPHDERLIRILGKDKEPIVEQLDVSSLSKPLDIRIQSSSALPENKYDRIPMILSIMQVIPNLFRPERVAQMMGFGPGDDYLDTAQIPVIAAQAENERFAQGKKVDSPMVWENQVVHWTEHFTFMQQRSFKLLPREYQVAVEKHMLGHEILMWSGAKLNPALQQLLATIPQYPLFFVPPAEPVEASTAAPLPAPPIPVGPIPEQAADPTVLQQQQETLLETQ